LIEANRSDQKRAFPRSGPKLTRVISLRSQ
jgi:hypothetical protein